MNHDFHVHSIEHESWLELCALASTGELRPQEWAALEAHVAACEECGNLLAASLGPALDCVACFAAVRNPISEPDAEAWAWSAEPAKARLLAAAGRSGAPPAESSAIRRDVPVLRAARSFGWRSVAASLVAAALLLLIASAAYQFGYRRGRAQNRPPAVSRIPNHDSQLRPRLAKLQTQRATLAAQIVAERHRIAALTERSGWQEAQIAQLRNSYASLALQNRQQVESLADAGSEQSRLLRRLTDTENSLATFRNDLTLEQAQYESALLRSTALDTEIDRLAALLRRKDEAIRNQQHYLSADHDIRDLMGARQLYIADVFDVDGGGKTRKPFGRVFYTKGKSLVFYAFDLGEVPGYRKAKTFQAWGSNGLDGAKPVNLGIFYMDNQVNRRWVLKSDNPKTLADINSLFVTLEPKGGSKRPSGRPFLYAYLHRAPVNHP